MDVQAQPPAIERAENGGPEDSISVFAAESSARRSRVGFWVMVVLMTISTALLGYLIWLYEAVLALAERHGWGNVPLDQFPVDPGKFDDTVTGIAALSSIFYLFGTIAFLYGMGTARKIIVRLLGPNALHFGWGWTVGSLFIPIWMLYRPWAGFGEIRQAITHMAKQGVADMSWKQTGTSVATVWLGAIVIIGSSVSKGLERQAEKAAAGEVTLSSFADSVQTIEIGGLCDTAAAIAIIVYALTLSRRSAVLVKKLSLRSVVSQF